MGSSSAGRAQCWQKTQRLWSQQWSTFKLHLPILFFWGVVQVSQALEQWDKGHSVSGDGQVEVGDEHVEHWKLNVSYMTWKFVIRTFSKIQPPCRLAESSRTPTNSESPASVNGLALWEWTRVVVNRLRPVGCYSHATMVGSKPFVFGGQMWAFDLNSRTFAPRHLKPCWLDILAVKSKPFWESYELTPGNEKPLGGLAMHQ